MPRRTLLLLALTCRLAGADPLASSYDDRVTARLTVETELSRHRTFAPVSLAPDLALRVASRWSVLLHTSRAALAESGAGGGVCLRGARETLGTATTECTTRASDLGASVFRELSRSLVVRAGLVARGPEPMAIAAVLGVAAHRAIGRWVLAGAPTLVSRLSARSSGIDDRLHVPLYATRSLARGAVYVRSGVEGTLETFADTFAIPFGIGGSVVVRHVQIGAEASLYRALGQLNNTAWRSASMYVQVSR